MNAHVVPARAEDLPAVLALLEENQLPKEGLVEHPVAVLTLREGERIVGSAALELYGASVLLRSVAVVSGRRGEGLGKRLTREALKLARERGAEWAYLLTETADGFFGRFGFRPVPRSEVSEGVRCSVEFVSACPKSARAMMVDLTERAR